jgi:hypothetical protein
MVIGRGFAWAHLPRTAGTATLAMFELFPDLIESADAAESTDQHATFTDRARQVEGKVLALNFRRLPAWVLSRAQRVARHGVEPDYTPAALQSPHELSRSGLPDERLDLFTGGGRFEVDRWLRVEHLADDFLGLIGGFHDVTQAEQRSVRGMSLVNAIDYDHDVSHWFTPAQLRDMYAHNPHWTALEERLYGALVLE